jgi:hypothetical protein
MKPGVLDNWRRALGVGNAVAFGGMQLQASDTTCS